MIAVSLNVGGGVRLIKPAKLCMCTHTLQTQRGRTHGAGCVRQWFRTAEPAGERRYENWNTHTHIYGLTYLCCAFRIRYSEILGGGGGGGVGEWCDMFPGKHSMLGRLINLDDSRTGTFCACSKYRLFWNFSPVYLFSSPPLEDGPI